MTLWRMSISCWIPKATNTLRICNTCFFFTTTMVARTHLSVMFVMSAKRWFHLPSLLFSLGNCFFSLISYLIENTVGTQLLGLIVHLTRIVATGARLAHTKIGKSLLMLQEIISPLTLLTIHSVDTKLKWHFLFRKTQTFDLSTKFPKIWVRTQNCRRQKADMKTVP
jgi:hypothetical protein